MDSENTAVAPTAGSEESTASPHNSHHDSSPADSSPTTNITASPKSMHGGHSHGMPILEMPNLEPQQRLYWEQYNTTTYFNAKVGSKPLLWMHAATAVVAFAVLLPCASLISFSSTAQWIYVPLQTVVLIAGIASFVFLSFYSISLGGAELYPKNVYGPTSVVLLATLVIHWVSLISKSLTQGFAPIDDVEYHNLEALERASHDSGNDCGREFSIDEDFETSLRCPRKPSALVSKLAHSRLGFIFEKFHRFANFVFTFTTVPLALMGYAYLMIGLFVGNRMGMGHNVFGLLAHGIKGSVFFLLGFFELARYFGAFASQGMAWNTVTVLSKDNAQPQRWYRRIFPQYPTMEFFQSFLIFFYGSTNIFLEHLGSTDGKWTPKDLQHASIAFMFLGGGLCGMVIESQVVNQLMGTAFKCTGPTSGIATRSWSLNPLPALTIFWTGVLMSQHQQETELATAIHVQWGTLLCSAAAVRLLTYLMLYIKAPSNTVDADLPQRPFTEIVVSFCLICGGMIFVLSNRESVESMIYQGIGSMFTLNVGVGISSLLVVAAAFAFAFKGWASRL